MGRVNPTAWIRVPVGGTTADPSVYTAIREALQEVSDSAKYLQADIDGLRAKVTSGSSSVINQTIVSDGGGGGGSGGGSVTSVGLSAPSEFSVSGSPVTLAGTLSLSWASQTANKVFASPNGSTGTPAFRALVDADLGSTNVVYTTGSYSNPAWITSLAGSKISGDISGNAANVNGIVTETHGGTGESTYTLGDTLYSDATNSLAKLSGNTTTTKKFLTQTGTGSASAAPSWGTISGSDVTGSDLTKTDDTNVTLTLGGTPVGSLLKAVSITAGWTGQLGLGRGGTGADLSATGGAGQYVKQATLGGAFTVGTIPASDIASGQALTSANDTNVTLTLGGTPSTALLKAASITAGWTGQLAVSRGGTGLSSLGTANQILGVNNGVTALEYKSVNAGTGISVTHGTGTITVANTGVTSVGATSPVASSGGATPTISLNAAYGDTLNPYGSKTANFVLAAPDGVAGVPSFRSLVAADIPNISAAKITSGTLALARGGTGADLSATGGTGQYVKQATAGGAFTVGTIPASDIASGAALIKVDDTNVTLTLGGTPASALLAATSLTLGWTGQLAVSRGGTGLGTAPTNGQLLIGNGTGYTLATLTQGSNVTITNGAGSITISATGNMTNPMTTIGDMIYASNTATPATPARLGLTTGGVMYGGASAPAWTATADATWDQTNKRFGLGTSSPQVRLHVDGTAATLDTDLYNNTDTILAVQNGGTGFRMVSATADPTNIGNVPAVVWMTGRGTVSAATAVSSGDYLGRVLVQGIATGGGRAVSSEIRAAVDAAPGTSFVPGRFEFFTTNSSGTQAERMRLTSDGYLGIGKTPSTVLDIVHTVAGNAAVNMANSSADPAATARFILNNSATSGGLQIRSSAHATEPSDILLYSSANNIRFYTGGNLRATILSGGNVGIGVTSPTSRMHLPAGTATASTAPLKFTSGTNLSTPEAGTMEFDGTYLYFTPAATRQVLATNPMTTAGDIIYGGTPSGGVAPATRLGITSGGILYGTTTAPAWTATTDLTWDQTNKRLGLGVSSPGYLLDMAETSTVTSLYKSSRQNVLTMNPGANSSAQGEAAREQLVLSGGANNFTGRNGVFAVVASHTGTGTVTRIDNIYVAAFSKTTAGTVTELAAFRADGPAVSTGTVTTAYGVYLDTIKSASVTTAYGIYQVGTSDRNYFAGRTFIGTTTADANSLLLTRSDTNGFTGISAYNQDAVSTGAAAYVTAGDGSNGTSLYALGAGYTTAGGLQQNSSVLYGSKTNGLNIIATNSTTGLVRMYAGGSAAANERMRVALAKNLTNNSATTVISLALGTNTYSACSIIYTIEANNATDYQAKTGIVHVAAARAAGAGTTQFTDSVTTAAVTTGTLASTWAATYNAGAGTVDVTLNANSSLTPTTLRVRYIVLNNGTNLFT